MTGLGLRNVKELVHGHTGGKWSRREPLPVYQALETGSRVGFPMISEFI